MANVNIRLLQEILESHLKAASSGRASGESIHIHQVADPIDMTQEAAEREFAGRMLERESAVVRRLHSALARMKDGSYGAGLECAEELAQTRLKIPGAELGLRRHERA